MEHGCFPDASACLSGAVGGRTRKNQVRHAKTIKNQVLGMYLHVLSCTAFAMLCRFGGSKWCSCFAPNVDARASVIR